MNESRRLEQVIRAYFQACNAADASGIAACLTSDAVQYNYPPGKPMRGGTTIAALFKAIVDEQGRRWTVDRVVVDAEKAEAAIEYSRFKTGDDTVVRGAEWFLFDPESGLIREIHAYTAAPLHPDLERHELIDFDYQGRGYPVVLPTALA
jgi:methyltransferase